MKAMTRHEQEEARLIELSRIIVEAQIEFATIKDKRKARGLGQHGSFTVYQTRRTRVKAHYRDGYVAARYVPGRKGRE